MKKMKKITALFLALVLVLSLVPAATAVDISDFSDRDEIKYVEAIDVLSHLNILEGSNGAFRPKDTVTRAEAAAMIARVALTRSVADNTVVATNRYTDMSGSSWAIKYVETCSNLGIIHGVGNQKYNPSGNVTGYQFIKMLLSAVGYGQNEEFVGPNWSFNAVRVAQEVDLFDGVDRTIDLETPATREECAQYAFNLLTKVDIVTYSPILGDYSSGLEPKNLGEKQYNLALAETDSLQAADAKGLYTIGGVRLSSNLEQYIGRSIRIWYVWEDNIITAVSSAYCNDIVLGENYYGYSYEQMTNPKSEGFVCEADDITEMEVYINGSRYDVNGNAYTIDNIGGKKGVKVTFVDSRYNGTFDGYADKVFVLEKQVAQLLSDPVVQGDSINISGVTDGYEKVDHIIGYEDLAYGDVVLFWIDGEGMLRIEKADSFVGRLSGTKSISSGVGYIISEETYRLSDLNGAGTLTASMYDIALAPTASYGDFRYYVDNGGYIIAAVPESGDLSDYVVIAGIDVVEPEGADPDVYVEALLVNVEGEKTIARLSNVIVNGDDLDKNGVADYSTRYTGVGSSSDDLLDTSGGRGNYVVNQDISALIGNTFFTYSQSQDVYTLSSVFDKTVNKVKTETGSLVRTEGERNDIQRGIASFSKGLTGNANTVFVVYVPESNKYEVYEGIAKVPDIELISTKETACLSVNGFAKYVFVGPGSIDNSSIISEDEIFLLSTTPVSDSFDSISGKGHGTYRAVVDGQLSTVKIKMSAYAVRSAGVGYKTARYDGDYIVYLNSNSKGLPLQNGYMVSDGTILLADDSAYSYTYGENGKAFIVDTERSGATQEVTIDELPGDTNDSVCVVIPTVGSATASYLVIFKNAPASPITIMKNPVSASYACGTVTEPLFVQVRVEDSQEDYLRYQWYKGLDDKFSHAEKVVGATDSTLVSSLISTAEEGTFYYFCEISHVRSGMQSTSVVSSPAVISVYGDVSAPVIQEISNSVSLFYGQTELPSLEVDVEAVSVGELSYQWYQDDVLLEGETNSTLDLSDYVHTGILGEAKFHVIITHTIANNPNKGITQSGSIFVCVLSAESGLVLSDKSLTTDGDDLIFHSVLNKSISGKATVTLYWFGATGWVEIDSEVFSLAANNRIELTFSDALNAAGRYKAELAIEEHGFSKFTDPNPVHASFD